MFAARLVLTLLLLAATLVPVQGAPRLSRSWVRVDAPSLVLYTDVDEERGRELALELERFRATVGSLLPGFQRRGAQPTRVFLFARHRSFERYASLFGAPAEIDALFALTPSGPLVLVSAGDRSRTLALLHHEAVHQLVTETAPRLPLWLNEGLAEVFTTFWADGETVEVGAANADYLYMLRSDGLAELDALLEVAPRAADYREPRSKSRLHAQAWLLTHLLMIRGTDFRRAIPTYLRAIDGGRGAQAAFAEAFDIPPAELRVELEKHLAREPFPSLSLSLPARERQIALQAAAAERSAVFEELGTLLAAGPAAARSAAREHLEAALDGGDRLQALCALAELDAREGRDEAAERRLDRADEIAPGSAAALLTRGRVALRRLNRQGGADEAVAERARDAFAALTARHPELVEGFVGMGRACLAGASADPRCGTTYATGRVRHPRRGELLLLRVRWLVAREELELTLPLLQEAWRTFPDRRWAVAAERVVAGSYRESTRGLDASEARAARQRVRAAEARFRSKEGREIIAAALEELDAVAKRAPTNAD